MNSNTEVSDDHIIQIPPDHTPNQSHEQTPIATSTNSPTPKHGSRGVNEMTPEELSSLKEDLRRHVCGDQWLQVKSIIDICPDMVRIPLNDSGDTALHLAVYYERLEIVKELVNRMRPEDMLIPNSYGDIALHLAPRKYNLQIVKELVNSMSPEDMLILDSRGNTALHLAVYYVRLEIVKELVNRMGAEDMVIQNSSGDTALHVAARESNDDIVNELVNRMRPEDMRILNSSGDTALHLAVKRGSLEIVNGLVKCMRPEDMQIQNSDGMLPVHLAAEYRYNTMVDILSSQKVLEKMDFKDIERLFMMTIRFDMFHSARQLFERHRTALAIARNEEDVTVVKMLEEKPRGKEDRDWLFGEVSTLVEKLEKNREDAIKSGNVEAVKMLIDKNPELVTYRDHRNGWNLLHLVVLFQQKNIFNSLPRDELKEDLVRVDNEGNNILHLAGRRPPVEFEELSSLRATIQMKRELEWFKFVEAYVPELRTILNHMGKRPIDVFYDAHKKLSEEIKETAKGIAESGMLVSTLVATVAFAAALTVPGDKTNAWFTVFILTNAVALFTSFASLLSFLSNFTSSRFAQSDFVKSLHPSLTFGRPLLFISVTAMVAAFTAASFLIFDHTSKWVSYAVASMGVFPILLFLLFQFNFFDRHLWSRYYRLSKQD